MKSLLVGAPRIENGKSKSEMVEQSEWVDIVGGDEVHTHKAAM
jgi:hypothetical protein